MRKYNNRTKKTIIIIAIVFVIFIIIFSWFLKKSYDVATTAYKVSSGSILFDENQNMIATTSEATIKMKWGGNYYLVYEDRNYNLGKNTAVYNSNNGDISLYGKIYEVEKSGDVKVIKNENKIESSVKSRFYKLADRKYLIIDRTIEAVNTSLVTSNYLMINLDKSGNATLLNNKVSSKTIVPTKIKTSSYIFDIANETINFGQEDIDLKKIIKSTNEYDEDKYDLNAEKKEEDENNYGSGTGTGSNTGGETNGTGTNSGLNGTDGKNSNGSNNSTNPNNNTTGLTGINGNGTTQGSSSNYNNYYDNQVSDQAVEEIIKATKNTSVIRVTPNIDSISVDYVIYDPNSEYKSVYVEVENTNTNQKNIIYLSKSNTNIKINDLTPNVYYNLTFKYTYTENSQTKEYKFDEFGTYTEIPKMAISAEKISNNKLYYKILLDNNYTITGGTLNLLLDGQIVSTTSVPTKGNVNQISGTDCYFDLNDIKRNENSDNILTIRLVAISFNTYTVKPNLSYKFKY